MQPVALVYSDSHRIAWVGDEPGLHNVLKILARTRPVRLDVRLCEPLHGAQLADRKSIASAAHQAIGSALANEARL